MSIIRRLSDDPSVKLLRQNIVYGSKTGGDVTSGKRIHHTDRGCQYSNKECTTLLIGYSVNISITEDVNHKDNKQAILFYNTRRPHTIINMITSMEASTHASEINKGWISFRNTAIKHIKSENFISEECLSLSK